MTFSAWKKEVDAIFEDIFHGMTSDDFADWCWRGAYNDGDSPREAFDAWAEEEGF